MRETCLETSFGSKNSENIFIKKTRNVLRLYGDSNLDVPNVPSTNQMSEF